MFIILGVGARGGVGLEGGRSRVRCSCVWHSSSSKSIVGVSNASAQRNSWRRSLSFLFSSRAVERSTKVLDVGNWARENENAVVG